VQRARGALAFSASRDAMAVISPRSQRCMAGITSRWRSWRRPTRPNGLVVIEPLSQRERRRRAFTIRPIMPERPAFPPRQTGGWIREPTALFVPRFMRLRSVRLEPPPVLQLTAHRHAIYPGPTPRQGLFEAIALTGMAGAQTWISSAPCRRIEFLDRAVPRRCVPPDRDPRASAR